MTRPQTVTVAGLRFKIRIDGPEGAPWLVFSNSLLTDYSMWDEQVAAVAHRFRVLRYDQRGHGGTAIPSEPCSFERLADDVACLLDHVGAASAAFVGLSMGAVTGLAFASRHPQRVTRMMLCDSPAAAPPGAAALWQSRIDLAVQQGLSTLVQATLGRWFLPETLAAAPPRVVMLRALMEATPLAGFAACAAALMNFDLTSALPKLTVPVLFAAGAMDGVLPAVMRRMAADTPCSQFREIAQAGHLPNIERPKAFLVCLNEALEPT